MAERKRKDPDTGLPIPTQGQWLFTHHYVATNDKVAAYRQAFPNQKCVKENNVPMMRKNAYRCLQSKTVQGLLLELREEFKQANGLTLEQHMAELQVIRDMAKDKGDLSAATRAEFYRGKAAGLHVEKTMNVNVNLSEEEILKQMAQLKQSNPEIIEIIEQAGSSSESISE